jgi:hypothetical protein
MFLEKTSYFVVIIVISLTFGVIRGFISFKKISLVITIFAIIMTTYISFKYFFIIDDIMYQFNYKLISNLLPAMFFLYTIDLKSVFENKIGCACHIGTKNYWLLLVSSIFASLFAQIVSSHNMIISILIATILGYILHRYLYKYQGAQMIAQSMLYILSSIITVQMGLYY